MANTVRSLWSGRAAPLAFASLLAAAACGDSTTSKLADAAAAANTDDVDAAGEDAGAGNDDEDAASGDEMDATLALDAGDDVDAGTSDAGTSDAGTSDAGTSDAGTSDAGADASSPCSHPLQCQPGYPTVPYPAENPANDKKALLGKILFWEEQIGELDTMACGTCHRAGSGGSDPRAALSPAAHRPGPDGILDAVPGLESDDVRGALGVPMCSTDGTITNPTVQATGRKPPSYLDAMFALEIFWDGRAGYCKNGEAAGGCFYDPDLPANAAPRIVGQIDPTAKRRVGGALEAQASGPPASSVEMACAGQSWTDIARKLRDVTPLVKASAIPTEMSAFIAAHDHSYPKMFEAVYGDTNKLSPGDANDAINARRIVYAIATHERRLTSTNTPWDRWNAGEAGAMTAQQVKGFEVFMGKGRCATCHAPPLFTDLGFHYVGFHKPATDLGRAAISGALEDTGKIKTPTVRNAGLREAGGLLRSGDGSGHDLASMMRAYKQGGLRTDPEVIKFIDPALEVLDLTSEETDALIDFMRNALTDPRAKNETAPFDRPKLGTE